MATEENNGSTDETSGQEQQGQQQSTSSETGGKGSEQQSSSDNSSNSSSEPVKLADDHPLVKTLAAQKQELATLKSELTETRAKLPKVAELEEELKKRPTPEALETLQTRYDRLEGFLQAVGGPLSKALDSRTFTRDLFETDKSIKDIIAKFEKDNPSATSVALGKGAPTSTGSGKMDPNELIRIARGK